MKILMIGFNDNIFQQGTNVVGDTRERHIKYAQALGGMNCSLVNKKINASNTSRENIIYQILISLSKLGQKLFKGFFQKYIKTTGVPSLVRKVSWKKAEEIAFPPFRMRQSKNGSIFLCRNLKNWNNLQVMIYPIGSDHYEIALYC